MTFTRRQFVGTTLTAAIALATLPGLAQADAVDDAISAFTGGAEMGSDGITLIAPEIAENGNTVPIEVDAPGAESIIVFAPGNPNPDVATFNFGPLSGSSAASTRIRLAGEQDVIAVARMRDGTYQMARQNVRVTIGGCGG
ncbi:thiosulfate oxidation carrier protein SoxY [Fontisubflavum oceani]|uniref:thiosulfate oxidation carrier protein SoxY n=1 Tax=Fontisubflavum oceani TaxID=2978973 RepID=UPI0025B5D25C|nr:thiosulfate oxidation carrier protein SoxY [Fontisubflavum oceani]WJY20489.1 thiosulfate oxidation carrier protein SoxY [Fontisubflavum oceani]